MSGAPPCIDRLNTLAPVLVPGGVAVEELSALSGGASQELWSMKVVSGAAARRIVLRRAPGGNARSVLAAPIELEAELITAANARSIPSPQLLYVLKEADGLGAGFFMEHVEGEALGTRIVRHDKFAEIRPRLARQCGEILARIHALPKPPGLTTKTTIQSITELEQQHRLEDWPRPIFELAFKWLRDHAPPDAHPTVVHGDFRNGNLLIGPDGVRAVLDWELAHAGDPAEDLAWICVNSWRFGSIDLPVGGFGRREDLYAGYAAAGGAPVDVERAHFWEVYGTLRWGVICTMSGIALRTTATRSVERAMIARRASETELDLLNLLERG